jgi:hypothetical protein
VVKRRDLKDALELYSTLQLGCTKAAAAAECNPGKFAQEYAANIGRTTGDRGSFTREFFQDLFDKTVAPILYEICFLDLVRVFEDVVFRLAGNACGKIRGIVAQAKTERYPFKRYAENFVKAASGDIADDVHNLGDVKAILKGKLSDDLYQDLSKIVDYRNWLAHGNRFTKKPGWPGELSDVAETLERILTQISS